MNKFTDHDLSRIMMNVFEAAILAWLGIGLFLMAAAGAVSFVDWIKHL